MGDAVEVREISSVEDLHACEDLQRRAWNFAGDLDIVPLTQMVAVGQAGGLVLGAFDAEAVLIGFCYSFVGREADGGLFHYSHMTAVDERVRSAGLGARLKWAQREAVLRQGIERIVWTYDPLESLNGYFNFSKLGVIARVYWRNLYGETSSALHRGTPTDRLKAEWLLSSERVESRRRGETSELGGRVRRHPEELPCVLQVVAGSAPSVPDLSQPGDTVICEIPPSVQGLKQADPGIAREWRMATREVFEHYLEQDYVVCECVRTDGGSPRTLYVLHREAPDASDRY